MAIRDDATTVNGDLERRALATLGVILTRVVVPLWLFVGAVLKLADGSPANLPSVLVKWLGAINVNLLWVLQMSIVVELVVVGVMWLLPGLARAVGLLMLGCFMPVLLGEVLLGASSCGCFGAVSVHPAITLTMDVAFFVGMLVLGSRAPSLRLTTTLPTVRTVAAGLWAIASCAVTIYLVAPAADSSRAPGGVEGGSASAAVPLPAEGYHLPDYASWIGRAWSDVPTARWIVGESEMLAQGTEYVMFYRKDCEHCHELMEVYFAGELTVPTTAVAVPERDGYPAAVLDFPCLECRHAELPSGVDWFLQTPVLVRLEDGLVACAAEVEVADPQCIAW